MTNLFCIADQSLRLQKLSAMQLDSCILLAPIRVREKKNELSIKTAKAGHSYQNSAKFTCQKNHSIFGTYFRAERITNQELLIRSKQVQPELIRNNPGGML